MAKMIVVDHERCLACGTCVVACAMAHTDAATLAEAAVAEKPPQSRVHLVALGDFGMPMQCRHCQDAPCMMICPKEAISRSSPDAPVLIDPELCIGCRFCILVCPFGIIEMSRQAKAVVKCDLCIQRTTEGEPPACVAACPTSALRFVELDETLCKKRRDEARRIAESDVLQSREDPEAGQKKVACALCGREVAPAKQLQRIREKLPDHVHVPNVCHRCRRAAAAAMLAQDQTVAAER